MYKPNLNVPLASSYNERGVTGFTHTQTNSEDQRKINCMYEVTKNALTGQGKLSLTKRPGVTINPASFGASSQAAYLIILPPFSASDSDLTSSTNRMVIVTDGGTLKSINSAGASSTVVSISATAAYLPVYIDTTNIGGISNIVLQIAKPNNPKSSFADQKVFFFTSAWTEITDADFLNIELIQGKMEFMDGFAFALSAKNIIYSSDVNSLANWTATSFITKQIKEDFAVGLARLNNQIIAFGNETMEVFYNAGNATGSPLLPIKQLYQKVGCAHIFNGGGQTHYYCIIEGKLYFVGRRAGGKASLGLFVYNGSNVEKVSSSFIDKILGEEATSIYAVQSVGFHGQSAVAITLTAPTAATQRWLMFFPEWKDWFEWNSTTFFPSTDSEYMLGVTPNQHKIYNFPSSDNWQDAGTNFTASTQFKLPQDGHQRKRMAEFGVLADTARSSNQLLVEFSDDDYQSFQQVGNIDLARDIKTLNRGGSYRQRAVRLSSTNSLETRLHAFVARIE